MFMSKKALKKQNKQKAKLYHPRGAEFGLRSGIKVVPHKHRAIERARPSTRHLLATLGAV